MDNFFIEREFDWKTRRASHVDRALNIVTRRLGIEADTATMVDKVVSSLIGYTPSPVKSGISTNIEQRMNLFHLVSQTLAYNVEGDLVELGCNEGQSTVLITRTILMHRSPKVLHVYDSFEGLPSTSAIDGSTYKAGDLATTEDVLIHNVTSRGLPAPQIHKGWFDKTLPNGLPDAISFALLDGDLYDSIMVSLKHVYPRLSKGAVCVIDDYCDPAINPHGWNHLPGVKKACDEFMAGKPEEICYIYSGAFTHAYFRKQ